MMTEKHLLDKLEFEVKNLLETEILVGGQGLCYHLCRKLNNGTIYFLIKNILIELGREIEYASLEPAGIFGPKRKDFCQTILYYIRIGRISSQLTLLPTLGSIKARTVQELLSFPERWYQGNYCKGFAALGMHGISNSSCCCLLGACSFLSGQEQNDKTIDTDKLRRAIHSYAQSFPKFKQFRTPTKEQPWNRYNIAIFNDNPQTTFEDIQAVLAIAGV